MINCELLYFDFLVVFFVNTDQYCSGIATVGCVELIATEEGARDGGPTELDIKLAVRLHICLALNDAIVKGVSQNFLLFLSRNRSFDVFFFWIGLLYHTFSFFLLLRYLIAYKVSQFHFAKQT